MDLVYGLVNAAVLGPEIFSGKKIQHTQDKNSGVLILPHQLLSLGCLLGPEPPHRLVCHGQVDPGSNLCKVGVQDERVVPEEVDDILVEA